MFTITPQIHAAKTKTPYSSSPIDRQEKQGILKYLVCLECLDAKHTNRQENCSGRCPDLCKTCTHCDAIVRDSHPAYPCFLRQPKKWPPPNGIVKQRTSVGLLRVRRAKSTESFPQAQPVTPPSARTLAADEPSPPARMNMQA